MPENNLHSNLNLSIRFSSDGFSLYQYDEHHQLLSIKTERFSEPNQNTLVQAIADLPAHQHKNLSACSFIENSWYTFVPDFAQESDDFSILLRLQHPSLPENYTILHQPVPSLQGILIYGVPNAILDALAQQIKPAINPTHHLVPLLQLAGKHSKALITWMRDEVMDILIMKQSHLYLANSFSRHSTEDGAYHLLNICQQLSVDPETTPLICCERENNSSALLLQQYFPLLQTLPQTTIYENHQWKI